MPIHYQRVLEIKRNNPERINPIGKLKIGGARNLNDFERADLMDNALLMAEDLNTIHQLTSSANKNEKDVVETIQKMFEK